MTQQYTPLTPEDWEAQGYKRFKSTIKPSAAFGLQKRFDDEVGKKYFITIWVYDHEDDYHKRFMDLPRWKDQFSRYGFQPDVQLACNDVPFDISLHFSNSNKWGVTPIEYVERFFEKMWRDMDCDYYETWEN